MPKHRKLKNKLHSSLALLRKASKITSLKLWQAKLLKP